MRNYWYVGFYPDGETGVDGVDADGDRSKVFRAADDEAARKIARDVLSGASQRFLYRVRVVKEISLEDPPEEDLPTLDQLAAERLLLKLASIKK